MTAVVLTKVINKKGSPKRPPHKYQELLLFQLFECAVVVKHNDV